MATSVNLNNVETLQGEFYTNRMNGETKGVVRVSSGISSSLVPGLVGLTVGQVKGKLRTVFNIDPAAAGRVDGKDVGEDYILTEGDKNVVFAGVIGGKAR